MGRDFYMRCSGALVAASYFALQYERITQALLLLALSIVIETMAPKQ